MATASGGAVGLYGSSKRGYRMRLPNGKITRGKAVDGKNRPVPPAGRWVPLSSTGAAEETSKRTRRREVSNKQVAERITTTRPEEPRRVEMSSALYCLDCQIDLRTKKHAHDLAMPFPRAFCCRCVRARGKKCKLYEAARAAKKKERRRGKTG